ncbi:MAG: hypothetical protein ACE5DQ_02960 [Candidatus Paceibacterota bacterium]
MSYFKKHPFASLFLAGLTLRLLLLFIDFSFDVNNHISWAQDAYNRGLPGFYETPSTAVFAHRFPNYPPLSIFMFIPFYVLREFIFNLAWQANLAIPLFPSNIIPFLESRAFMAGVFKIPGLISDFALAWTLYVFAKKVIPKKKKLHIVSAALVLFHPTIFYNSSFWGQIDAIPILFTLIAVYLLLYTKRFLTSATSLMIALLIKPTMLVYVPVYALVFVKKHGAKKSLYAGLVSVILFWVSFLPFFSQGSVLLFPFQVYAHKILTAQSISFVSNSAYNAWTLNPALMQVQDAASFLAGLSYRIIGFAVTAVIFIVLLKKLYQRKLTGFAVLFALSLSAYTAFLFMTKMHERYMILIILPLLIPALKDKSLRKPWIVVSVVSFINLYKSFSVPSIPGAVDVLNSNPVVFVLSLINIAVYIYLFKRFIFAKPR